MIPERERKKTIMIVVEDFTSVVDKCKKYFKFKTFIP